MNLFPVIPGEGVSIVAEATFEKVRASLRTGLPDADIQHVGATSVAGAWTKGDLDLVVRVSPARFAEAVNALREAFEVRQPENWSATFASFGSDVGHPVPVGIQLVVRDSASDVFVWFRDRLAARPELLEAYNRLKHEHVGLGDGRYRQAKHQFITEVLGQWEETDGWGRCEI